MSAKEGPLVTVCPIPGTIGFDCLECAPGYMRRYSGSWDEGDRICVECPGTAVAWIITSFVLLFVTVACIGLAMLTIKAGYSRRSIHSIVIKIALAYSATLHTFDDSVVALASSSVIGSGWTFFQTIQRFLERVELLPFECLLGPQVQEYSNRFLYSSLIYSLLPVFVMLTATAFSAILYSIARPKYLQRAQRRAKLVNMLNAAALTNKALEVAFEIDAQRILGIWRYAEIVQPLTRTKRVARFLKDMVSDKPSPSAPDWIENHQIPVYIVTAVTLYTTVVTKAGLPLQCERYSADGRLRWVPKTA